MVKENKLDKLNDDHKGAKQDLSPVRNFPSPSRSRAKKESKIAVAAPTTPRTRDGAKRAPRRRSDGAPWTPATARGPDGLAPLHTAAFTFDKELSLSHVAVRRPDLTTAVENRAPSVSEKISNFGDDPILAKEFKKLREEVGDKAALKFRHVRDAFRFCDTDKDGVISRSECLHFFRVFNVDEGRSDRFFNHLDQNNSGEIDYGEFRKFFGTLVQPDYGPGANFGTPDPANVHPSGAMTARASRDTQFKYADSLNQIYCPRREINDYVPENIPAELRKICQLIGEKAPQRFRTVREAFRFVDADHDGKVDRREIQCFFRVFNIPEDAANKMFDYLDKDGNDSVDYNEFVQHFGPYIQPGYRLPERLPPAPSRKPRAMSLQEPQTARTSREHNKGHPDLEKMLRVVTEKAAVKWRKARECFRYVDADLMGFVTRDEVRRFLGHFGLPNYVADTLFRQLDLDKDGKVDYREFVDYFSPYIQPGLVVKRNKVSKASDNSKRAK